MKVRNVKRAAELVQCAVILHNLCILFSDRGDDPLDDEDLGMVDDELDVNHGDKREDRRQQLLQHFDPLSVRNDTNDTSKVQAFHFVKMCPVQLRVAYKCQINISFYCDAVTIFDTHL